MDWTPEQRAELERQYARIGFLKGERWAAPPPHMTPAQVLAMMQTIPDGAGKRGWAAALRANDSSSGSGTT